ncbi:GntR family transcriptional regulator [Kineosporia sp. J2-2]|uniref:GntR family transcriptional regulator n=1 Tax=Kineosporia corallincola TaxID=2835133 RepID=A0ABS5TBH4_9ACTN|nr:GntR family transcriptional regulator [Kineosporia corallincola]MBT0768432.1 GntR family transcriptional regulator [Kineosporia corallincola]
MSNMLIMAASLSEQVVAEVRAGIRQRRYVPGEIYSVYQLAEALGFSRSPVREAMLRLSEAGLVEISRNRGFRVLLPQARDLAEIFAVRLSLEVPAARRLARLDDSQARDDLVACMNAMENARDDEEFWLHDRRLHQLVLLGAGNRRAARIVAGLRETTGLLGEPTARTHAAICSEHRPIVEAVRGGDGAAAGEAMRAHLTSTGLLLMAEAAGVSVGDPSIGGLWREVSADHGDLPDVPGSSAG